MPYTPPSQRSPASTKLNTPILTRNHSYANEQVAGSPKSPQRPALPRSVSSTSYLNKQRRTPSIVQKNNGHATNGMVASPSSEVQGSQGHFANGAITTPPDSSDDEDRGRHLGRLKELHEALQHIDLKRGHSPDQGQEDGTLPTLPAPTETAPSTSPSRPALTPEARKISHSRSSSEITLSQHVPGLSTDLPLNSSSSDDSDVEDDELRIKPPLLRKKSGELVKPALRPSSRRRPSSMPGTPTFAKAVHFNEEIKQVRHFLQVDRPIAISAGSSPVDTYDSESEYPFGYDDGYAPHVVEWEIRLANFPRETFERKSMPVRVERIFLSADNKSLIGNVAVANIAFQKYVVARFTLDYWKTTSEVVAEYNNDVRKKQSNDGYDRFNFNIKLADQANLETKTLLLCVRYNVNGQEYWDNNGSMNYQVDFIKKTKAKGKGGMQGLGAGALGAIPRSRHSPPAARPRSMPISFDDDFGHGFEPKYEFGPARSDSPSSTIRLKTKSKNRQNFFPDQALRRANPAGQAFSTRYDFGASLHAALSTAQTTLGDRSGIKPKNTANGNFGGTDIVAPAPQSSAPAGPVPGARPDALSSEKPDLQSAEYNELIQKFCFFGTSGKPPQVTNPITKSAPTDGEHIYANQEHSGSSTLSTSKDMSPLVDGANDSKHSSKSPNHFPSRSTSPRHYTGSDIGDRTTSPLFYGTLFNHPHSGIFEPAHTAQTCV